MERKKRADSSGLFLLELILSILLFSILAAICVSLFAKAHALSRSSADLTFAAAETESAASVLRSSDSGSAFLTSMKALYPNADMSGDTVTVQYDKSHRECGEQTAVYRMTARLKDENGSLLTAEIAFSEIGSSETIYSQTAEHAVPEGAGQGKENS